MSESKQLDSFPASIRPIRIDQLAGEADIAVPAGFSRYLCYQPAGSGTEQQLALRFRLDHSDSAVQVLALIEAGEGDSPSLAIELLHGAPRTRAETVVRSLVSAGGHPRFTGKIRVAATAGGSESYLNHHSLLLDPTARSWSLPSLEILTDDVKCSHAATMRHFTELDRFYPRSRGLSREQSDHLLIAAFLADVAACKPSQA